MEPRHSGVHEDIAKVLLKTGDLDGAESEYRAAVSVYDAEYKTGEPTDTIHSMLRNLEKIEAKSHTENALAALYLQAEIYDAEDNKAQAQRHETRQRSISRKRTPQSPLSMASGQEQP